MNKKTIDSFPAEVVRKLKVYVYRLIDPRDGETFYVGKGKGDRVFSHVRAARDLEGDDVANKIKRIREIGVAGLEVGHVIHRHGLDDKTAVEVEASLIDAYPGLENAVGGAGSSAYGAMHANEIISLYSAVPAVFKHKALLINISRSAAEKSLYEATRYAWVLNKSRAEQAEVVLSTLKGVIVAAFIPQRWLAATANNFPGPGYEADSERYAFEGDPAPEEVKNLYVGKRVPDEYRPRGAANPIRYTW